MSTKAEPIFAHALRHEGDAERARLYVEAQSSDAIAKELRVGERLADLLASVAAPTAPPSADVLYATEETVLLELLGDDVPEPSWLAAPVGDALMRKLQLADAPQPGLAARLDDSFAAIKVQMDASADAPVAGADALTASDALPSVTSAGVRVAVAVSVGACWALPLVFAKTALPVEKVLASSMLAVAASLLAAFAPARRLFVPAAIATVGCGFAALVAKGFALGPLRAGVHCATFGLAVAALPLATTAVIALRGGIARLSEGKSPLLFASVAAAGSLAGQAALHVVCPGEAGGHLLMTHFGSVVFAFLVGAAIGQLGPLRRTVSQHTVSQHAVSQSAS